MLVELSKEHLQFLVEVFAEVEDQLDYQEIQLYEILMDALEQYEG